MINQQILVLSKTFNFFLNIDSPPPHALIIFKNP